ncbi:rubrerythrin family protein [Orenia metallireducens]|uniref:Rubrerythrin family protein n=1 Tax=Orenia metallireducens TaxID=1413210 RepID=A0A1C0A7Q3_9FIRM|nr:ferritin-like domain-containing protein [Orenia metallireducens]OCL26262.1 rubrerythrin family protein [Orenia metallireducens]
MNKLTKKDMLDIAREMMNMKREWHENPNNEDLSFLIQQIYLSIENELEAAAYYKALAKIAPNQFAAEMLSEFADDERGHAYQFQKAYERLTGNPYKPPTEFEFEFELEADDYEEYLESRILDETADFKKYKNFYLMTNNPYLRDIFFDAMHDDSCIC